MDRYQATRERECEVVKLDNIMWVAHVVAFESTHKGRVLWTSIFEDNYPACGECYVIGKSDHAGLGMYQVEPLKAFHYVESK